MQWWTIQKQVKQSSKFIGRLLHARGTPFTAVTVETLGAIGEEASVLFHDLGHRIAAVTAESRSFQFLMHRLSIVEHATWERRIYS
jgi:hypothetical protein